MSRLTWRDEERLREKIARLEDQIEESESMCKALSADLEAAEQRLEAALAEIKRLRA